MPVDLNARYLDALTLLVANRGQLVTKDRFLDEVWRGVPVTDEALTQCIKTLRRQLGDDAARSAASSRPCPSMAIASSRRSSAAGVDAGRIPVPAAPARATCCCSRAPGSIGAGMAGVVGGLLYGFAGASQPLQPGMGAASVLLVLVCLTIVAALIGGTESAFGIAAADLVRDRRWPWPMLGGALGGLVDRRHSPSCSGSTPSTCCSAGRRATSPARRKGRCSAGRSGSARGWARGLRLRLRSLARGIAGALAGIVSPMLGGRMMGGSLDLLAQSFPDSRLRLDQIGALFGELGFGSVAQIVTGGIEGLVFGACVIGAMTIARRQLAQD